jgi:FlaA1/EpsC-like NDP-sugar epimerase
MWTALVLIPGLSQYKPPERLLYGGVAQKAGIYLVNWFVIDYLVASLAIITNGLLWRLIRPIDIGLGPSLYVAIEFAVIFTVVGAILGIQKIHWSKASPADVLELAISSIIATILLFIINQFHPQLPTHVIVTSSLTTFAGYVIARYRFRLVTGLATRFLNFRKGSDIFKEKVLIIGSGDAGLFAAWLLENSRDASHIKVVGFIDDDFQKQGGRARGIPILGGRNDIPDLVRNEDIGIILFAIHNISQEEKNSILRKCTQTSARLVILPDVLGKLNLASPSNGHKPPADMQAVKTPIFNEIQQKLIELEQELHKGNIEESLAQLKIISNLVQTKKDIYAELLEK